MKSKYLRALFASVLGIALACGFGACATSSPSGDPLSLNQQALNATGEGYKTLAATTRAADASAKQGVLKGNDLKNVVKGLDQTKAGLDVTYAALLSAQAAATAASAPASGATK